MMLRLRLLVRLLVMAAEVTPGEPGSTAEIVQRLAAVEDLLTEMATEFRGLLDDFRPLLDRYRSTNGGTVGLLRARRSAKHGGS